MNNFIRLYSVTVGLLLFFFGTSSLYAFNTTKTDRHEGVDILLNDFDIPIGYKNYYSRWSDPKPFALPEIINMSNSSMGMTNTELYGSFNNGIIPPEMVPILDTDDATHGSFFIGLTDIKLCNAITRIVPQCVKTHRNGIVQSLNEATRLTRTLSIAGSVWTFAKVNVEPADGGVCKAGSKAMARISTSGLIDNLFNATVLITSYKGQPMEHKTVDLGLILSPPILGAFGDATMHDFSFKTTKPYDTIHLGVIGGINAFSQIGLYYTACSRQFDDLVNMDDDDDLDQIPNWIEQELGLRTDNPDSDGDGINDADELDYDDILGQFGFSETHNDNDPGNDLFINQLKNQDTDGDQLIDAIESRTNGEEKSALKKELAWDFFYSDNSNPKRGGSIWHTLLQWRFGLPYPDGDYGAGFIGLTGLICNIPFIGDLPIFCPVINISAVASENLTEGTKLWRILDITGSANVWAKINVRKNFNDGHCKAGSLAQMVFSTRGLVDHLINFVFISTYKNGKLMEVRPVFTSIVGSTPITSWFTDNEVRSAGFITTKEYDTVHLSIASLAGVAPEVTAYHARCSKDTSIVQTPQ